jgi:hypothetical protein
MMYIGNDLIEAVPLQQEGSSTRILGKFKRNLKIKYRELISQTQQPPGFW